MDLIKFQVEASTEIANKFAVYAADPLTITRTRVLPFYQNLNSITGSGKTLILADAITQIRSQLPVEPIVLWLSKGKVVVWQTFTNLTAGKYAGLIGGFRAKQLLECRASDIENASSGLLLVATVGKFNRADKDGSDRKVFQLAFDFADVSLWDMLKNRRDALGRRRPFIIVYDEGHNLSDQQMQLLLDLDPDALIAASATTRIPAELGKFIARLRDEKGWKDEDFITAVPSSEVVGSGLVKQDILLGGYVTPMEIAIDDMLTSFRRVEASAAAMQLPFQPKAIYVTNTNLVSGGNADNVHAPFRERMARPILIWRHLVENCGVDPKEIAVYCNLKFDAKYPEPHNFNLFAGGDNDYDKFIKGEYRHIIFNLSLQEGWDDPACYFAYIDKDMGSREQITQVVGRVLRQPEATHYADPALNTAHFYIRTDERSVFDEVLQEVQAKISAESPDIKLTVFTGGKGSAGALSYEPKKVRMLPEVSVDFSEALEPIQAIVGAIQDFSQDNINTVGKGSRVQVLQTIGAAEAEHEEWVEVEHSNRVTARWIFVREIQKTYHKAINLCDIELPKFDALVEYYSPAAEHLREAAQKVVAAYLSNSKVIHNSAGGKPVPAVSVDPSSAEPFTNALHARYSGLNGLELPFAKALDATKRVWFRNPSRGCFEIPLLAKGPSHNFNPDFVVWLDNAIVAIDTKGDHLIVEDAGRKLFYVEPVSPGPELRIRLLTQGKWNDRFEKIDRMGYTVWQLRQGKPHPVHVADMPSAVAQCLK